MRVSSIDGVMSTEVKEGVELPKFIRTLTIETAEEEQQVRLFLTGGLKFDESGCRALGRDFGSNALSQSSDVSNGNVALGVKPNGSRASMGSNALVTGIKEDYSLKEKLRIIETLSGVIQRSEPIVYPHTKKAEEKLLALIQSI